MGNGASAPKQECTGNPKADAYASLGTHGVLAVTSMVPFVGCGAAIADVGLTTAEESGLLCGGELQTPDGGWRAVNMTLAVTGATLSCIPGIGTIFGGVKGAFSWFGGLFKGLRAALKVANVATKAVASASNTVTHIATKAVASASKVVKGTGAAKLSELVAAPVAKVTDLAAHHTAALTEAVKRATIAPTLVKVGRFTGASVATRVKSRCSRRKLLRLGVRKLRRWCVTSDTPSLHTCPCRTRSHPLYTMLDRRARRTSHPS